MTDDNEYEDKLQEVKTVYEERKMLNKRFLSACERNVHSTPASENPTKWVIGKVTFQELNDVWDNFERVSLFMVLSIQNLDHRIQALENVAVDVGSINREDITSVAKFAQEFREHVEESKKKLAEYKRKMEENDLAT